MNKKPYSASHFFPHAPPKENETKQKTIKIQWEFSFTNDIQLF